MNLGNGVIAQTGGRYIGSWVSFTVAKLMDLNSSLGDISSIKNKKPFPISPFTENNNEDM